MDKPISVSNPMGYYCAPNGCTPDYQSKDLKTIIAYGLMLCHSYLEPNDSWSEELRTATMWDVKVLRESFLNTIEAVAYYLNEWREDEKQQAPDGDYDTDHSVTLGPDGDDDPTGEFFTEVRWYIDRYDPDRTEDGGDPETVLLSLHASCLSDDIVIFLDLTDTTEEQIKQEVQAARDLLGQIIYPKGWTE